MNPQSQPPHPHLPGAISRRGALTALGAGAATVSAPFALGGAAHAAAEDPSFQVPRRHESFDAVVIGAGFSGVVAARELRAQGLETVILEARDRIGGRTWTEPFAGAEREIDLGGQWVYETQELVMAEMAKFGIDAIPELLPSRAYYPTPDGQQYLDPGEVFGQLGETVAELFAGSEEYLSEPLDPLHRADLIRRIEHLTLEDGINALELGGAEDLWIRNQLAGFAGGSNDKHALTSLAQWWALGGWDAEGWFGLMGARPDTGMGGLIRRIHEERPGEIRFNTQVTEVAQRGETVYVKDAAGHWVSAPRVVVAVPVNLWDSIRFRPGLPAAHQRTARTGSGVPRNIKFLAVVEGIEEPTIAAAPVGSLLPSLFPNEILADGSHLMIGFAFDSSFDTNNVQQVQDAVRSFYPKARVRETWGHDWGADPFAKGGQALRKPYQLLRELPDVHKPHGRVAFAGADIAAGWHGFVDGAIESGLRAAAQLA